MVTFVLYYKSWEVGTPLIPLPNGSDYYDKKLSTICRRITFLYQIAV